VVVGVEEPVAIGMAVSVACIPGTDEQAASNSR